MADDVFALLAPGADLPPCDKRTADLYDYWLSIRPSPGLLPGRRNFHPTDVPQLLQWIWLVDVQRKPLRFKYRLVGTAHVDDAASNPTGQSYDAVHPRFRSSSAYPQFVAVAEQAQVAFYCGPPVYVIDYEHKTIERLILPMAQNGSDVDMLLAITALDPQV